MFVTISILAAAKRLLATLGLVAATTPAPAAAIETLSLSNGERAYLLPVCPRAAALDYAKLTGPENIWSAPQTGPAGGGTTPRPEALGTLAAALAVPLIDVSMNALQAWLDERAKEKTHRIDWIASGYASIGPTPSGKRHKPQCVVLISGAFEPAVAKGSEEPARDEQVKSGGWSKAWLAAFALAAPPDVYLEVELAYALGNTAWQLRPVYFEYRKSGIRERDSKPRDVALTFAFAVKGTAAGATAMSVAKAIRPNSFVPPAMLAGIRSPWVPATVPNGRQARSTPLSIQVHMIESSEPTQVDRILARTFAVSKQPLSDSAKSVIAAAVAKTGSTGANVTTSKERNAK